MIPEISPPALHKLVLERHTGIVDNFVSDTPFDTPFCTVPPNSNPHRDLHLCEEVCGKLMSVNLLLIFPLLLVELQIFMLYKAVIGTISRQKLLLIYSDYLNYLWKVGQNDRDGLLLH